MQYPLKKLGSLAALTLAGFFFASASNLSNNINTSSSIIAELSTETVSTVSETSALYNELHLEDVGMNMNVFTTAMQGFYKLNEQGSLGNSQLLTIVDFSQPSTQRRLYVIDLENKQILFNTLVAHGKNTGSLWAQSFSNRPSSLKSSPGFYSTAETYIGENGLSLRLDGLERNINDNARNRAIVMHGAPYVNQSSINNKGSIGRSWGCPAVPVKEHRQIINTIKNGTCLFIYSPDQQYISNSTVLNS